MRTVLERGRNPTDKRKDVLEHSQRATGEAEQWTAAVVRGCLATASRQAAAHVAADIHWRARNARCQRSRDARTMAMGEAPAAPGAVVDLSWHLCAAHSCPTT